MVLITKPSQRWVNRFHSTVTRPPTPNHSLCNAPLARSVQPTLNATLASAVSLQVFGKTAYHSRRNHGSGFCRFRRQGWEWEDVSDATRKGAPKHETGFRCQNKGLALVRNQKNGFYCQNKTGTRPKQNGWILLSEQKTGTRPKQKDRIPPFPQLLARMLVRRKLQLDFADVGWCLASQTEGKKGKGDTRNCSRYSLDVNSNQGLGRCFCCCCCCCCITRFSSTRRCWCQGPGSRLKDSAARRPGSTRRTRQPATQPAWSTGSIPLENHNRQKPIK